MGRPALYLIRIHTTLSAETLNRIERRVGEKGRAAFIREAVDRWLDEVEGNDQQLKED